MIHINIGSNLDSKFGNRFDNISMAINMLIESKLKIIKVSNFFETPSYPNKKDPNFLNVGLLANYGSDEKTLIKIINLIELKIGRINQEGLTLIPTKLYFLKGKVKVEIAVAKGKKLYDKRQVKKTRDWNREKARLLSKNNK